MTLTTLTRRIALVALAGLIAAGAARAADPELVKRDYEPLRVSISVPKEWTEKRDRRAVKWEVEGKPQTCEVTLYPERKDLADVERNLKAKATENKWKEVEESKRIKVDGCDAFFMLVDIPGAHPLRQLFTVIDGPQATYLFTYGDIAADFDRKLVDLVVQSFQRIAVAEGATSPPVAAQPGAAAGDWGCAACKKPWPATLKFCGDCGGKCQKLEPEKTKWGCAACKKEWAETMKFCGECGAKNDKF